MTRVILLSFLLSGCAAAFGQTDNFKAHLDRGCSTADECDALVTAAQARDDRCAPNTLGSLKCSDTRADLNTAANYRRRVDRKAEEAERNERQAELEQQRRDRAAEVEQRKEREERQAAAKERAAWLTLDLPACSDRGERNACMSVQTFITDHPENEHVDEAAAALKAGRAVMAGLDAEKRKRTEEAAAIEADRDHGSRAAASPSVPRVSTPPASAPPTGAVCCCDGSISPTCTTVHRGCCSHHGGVCACN